MNSKERVLTTLAHAEPDQVPVDFWVSAALFDKLISATGIHDSEVLIRNLGVDVRYIEGAVYTGPEIIYEDGSYRDCWGVRSITADIDLSQPQKGTNTHVLDRPLAAAETVREIEAHSWPSPGDFDFSMIGAQADKLPGMCIVSGAGIWAGRQLDQAIKLRGFEQCMVDTALNPNILEAIITKEMEFYLPFLNRFFDNAQGEVDIFLMGDDFGTQKGLTMSIETWRRFFKPGFRALIDLAHSFGLKIMHHTCGGIYELIPEFITCGLDVLQSLQPRAAGMDLAKIKREYGEYICFQGGIDVQRTMPLGTPEDVKKEVRDVMRVLGEGGGYILGTAHNMLPDVPVENALAYFEAATQYGEY